VVSFDTGERFQGARWLAGSADLDSLCMPSRRKICLPH